MESVLDAHLAFRSFGLLGDFDLLGGSVHGGVLYVRHGLLAVDPVRIVSESAGAPAAL